VIYVPKRFYPHLQKAPLTFGEAFPYDAPTIVPAARLLAQEPHKALPKATLKAIPAAQWIPQRDLLSSTEQDQHFVAEVDNDGRAHLRFGDSELGRMPAAGTEFSATYRVGNGLVGNVGAEAISHIVFRQSTLSGGITRVRNPMAAKGGVDPELLAEIKLFAPQAFRREPQRAITADDYARLAERNAKVQRVAAALRWTGSWYEVLVAIDPFGTEEADEALLSEIAGYLYCYRRMGHDLVVQPAHYVPLDIELSVCVKSHYLRGHVEAALLDVFGNRALPGGRLGFFHPDKLSFGEGIDLSKLVAGAQAVEGVENVQVAKLQRKFEAPDHEIENGILPLGPTEIGQLDNDPSVPEHGTLALVMRGGR
jgi:predicted phage baseplate assembly protein